jgi:hypothetical protein
MRLARVRFTVRRTMIAVAVVALGGWGVRLAQWRAYCLTRAEVDASRAEDYAMRTACLRDEYNRPGMYQRLHDHWAALARKYRGAAARPWLPVAPDPPQPE